MSARSSAVLLAALLMPACTAEPPKHGRPVVGPGYSTADIYRLDFQGIRLGMRRDEACRRLIANGYHERNGVVGCGPLGFFEEGDDAPSDDFFGSAPGGWCHSDQCRPNSPSANVQFFDLEYQRRPAGDFVTKIYVWTAEPNSRAALAEATIRDWGQPSYYHVHGYSQLIYGHSRKQSDFENRSTFDSCRYGPECEIERGTDCGAVLNDFATVNASVTIYDWGRVIEIEDPRPWVDRLRADGKLRGRRFDGPGYLCSPAQIH